MKRAGKCPPFAPKQRGRCAGRGLLLLDLVGARRSRRRRGRRARGGAGGAGARVDLGVDLRFGLGVLGRLLRLRLPGLLLLGVAARAGSGAALDLGIGARAGLVLVALREAGDGERRGDERRYRDCKNLLHGVFLELIDWGGQYGYRLLRPAVRRTPTA